MKKELKSALVIYKESFQIPQVRSKIVKTFLILLFFRFLAHIPVPGVRTETLRSFFAQNQFLALLDMFSGGTLANFSICALGLNPYINASVMFQLLGFVFPQIEELRKEGEYGRQKIARWTRYATVPLGILQSLGMYALLKSQNVITAFSLPLLIGFVLTMTAGTVILIFLGELINQYGLGNGTSLLIFSGIVSRYPLSFFRTFSVASQQNPFNLIAFLLMAVGVVAGIVFVDEAFLRVPIRHARRAVSGGSFSQESFLPLKINAAGVMPIIFALSLVSIPQLAGRFVGQTKFGSLQKLGNFLTNTFAANGFFYNFIYFCFVVAFAYLYTSVVFNPKDVSENLRKTGSFIPGVRPGISTEKRLSFLLSRVTVTGAIFLGVIAVLPAIAQKVTGISTIVIGGTGILIVVSVVLELHRLLENLVQTWRYQSYQF